MRDSQFTARVASITALLLFVALLVSHFRDRADLAYERAVQDSMAAELWRSARVEETLLQAGDYLPDVRVMTSDRGLIALRGLPRAGRKYLYLYRKNCPPCQLLDSVLGRVPAATRDSIAFIAFHRDSTLEPEALPGHYSWVIDSITRNRYLRYVPALLVVDATGRVVSAAQEGLPRVSKLFDLYNVIHESDVDSVLLRAQNRLSAQANSAATGQGAEQVGSTKAVSPPR